MGKRSRRKKPAPRGGGAVHSNLPPASVADFASGSQFVLERFRQPTDEFYGLTGEEAQRCLAEGVKLYDPELYKPGDREIRDSRDLARDLLEFTG